jgi:hypothetical protein
MSPVFDGAGRLTNFVGVQADVTARVQAEAEREEAYRAPSGRRGRLAVLAGVSAALSTTLDAGEALHRMAAELVPAFADWCAVDLAEPQAACAGSRSRTRTRPGWPRCGRCRRPRACAAAWSPPCSPPASRSCSPSSTTTGWPSWPGRPSGWRCCARSA